MEAPRLCKKHFFQVANYYDQDVAFQYEIDGDNCLICTKVVFVEGARRFVEQNKSPLVPDSVQQLAE